MVEHPVEYQPHAALVGGGHERVEIGIVTEPPVDPEVVDRVVPVRLRCEDRPEEQPVAAELDRVVQPRFQLRQPVPDRGLIEDPDPARDAWEFEAVAQALKRRLPLLAICRGLQVLNVALDGTLVLHVPNHDDAKYENVQPLRYAEGAELQFPKVNSSHHQALDRLGSGLVVEAWSVADGVIEQARLADYPFGLAVQYHPERDALYQPLFKAFVDRVA